VHARASGRVNESRSKVRPVGARLISQDGNRFVCRSRRGHISRPLQCLCQCFSVLASPPPWVSSYVAQYKQSSSQYPRCISAFPSPQLAPITIDFLPLTCGVRGNDEDTPRSRLGSSLSIRWCVCGGYQAEYTLSRG
jgi:hypothetical protein